MAEENPQALQEWILGLKELGKYPSLQPFLRRRPEIAGLLATVDQPGQVAELLDVEDDRYHLLLGLYARYLGREDANALTEALRVHRDLIVQLLRRGLVGAEVLFFYSRNKPGSREYDRWLRDNIRARLIGKDESLASFLQMVITCGSDLRAKLNDNPAFRDNFRTVLWPRLMRVVEEGEAPLEFYIDESYLWDLLALEDGEKLLKRHGLLPIRLLFGPEAYPAKYHALIIRILLSGNEVTYKALVEGAFRKEEAFLRLLERPLSSSTLAAALNKLHEDGNNYRPRLEQYNKFDDATLTEDVGPAPSGLVTWLPLYPVYKIARKYSQGRDTAAEDWIEAGIDTAMLFVPLGTVVGQTGKQAGKAVVTQSLKQLGAKEAAKMAASKAASEATKKIASVVAKKGMEKQAARVGMSFALTQMQSAWKTAVTKVACFDITEPVKFFFKISNVGRESFKRLTGLEARLFMRKDARVFIHIDKLAERASIQYMNRACKKIKEKAMQGIWHAEDEQVRLQCLGAWLLANQGQKMLPPPPPMVGPEGNYHKKK